jgi:hypothetical protein
VPGPGQPGTTAQPTPLTQASPTQPGPSQPTQPGPTSPPALATPITLAPPQVSPPSQPTSAAPSPTAPSTAGSGQIVVVRGTGGAGARLRAQPGNNGQIITVVPEYTPLVVIGPDRQVDGIVWRNVRAPNGPEGWIAASFVTTGQ